MLLFVILPVANATDLTIQIPALSAVQDFLFKLKLFFLQIAR